VLVARISLMQCIAVISRGRSKPAKRAAAEDNAEEGAKAKAQRAPARSKAAKKPKVAKLQVLS
jgi:hypothetical protein